MDQRDAGTSYNREMDASETSVVSGMSETTISDVCHEHDVDPMHAQSLPMEVRRNDSINSRDPVDARPESIEQMQS
jgi:hypothetical protein